MRLDRYTPQLAKKTSQWIESILGEHLASPDLLEALKDGTVLCKLVNLLTPDALRFKISSMPFVQMENISHFLRACQSPPIGLAAYDCFQTVDLYEGKDPTQVLQCIGAFSRRAHALQPKKFPTDVDGRAGAMSPQISGMSSDGLAARARNASNVSAGSNSAANASSPGRSSQYGNGASPPPAASSWAKRSDQGATAPGWNIAQYGWTGGASQGNQGISFGGRRQIVSNAPHVPNLAEKEKLRREREAEESRQRLVVEEDQRRRRIEREADEKQAREEESVRWEQETRQEKERERQEVEAEKKRWEAEERKWKEEEERRKLEERQEAAKLEAERSQRPKLQGQYLSQYKAEQIQNSATRVTSESDRIRELEHQLEEAKKRERKYEEERVNVEKQTAGSQVPVSRAPSMPAWFTDGAANDDAAVEDEQKDQEERDYLHEAWSKNQDQRALQAARPLPNPELGTAPYQPPRPLPVPEVEEAPAQSPRPLPTASVQAAPGQPPRPHPSFKPAAARSPFARALPNPGSPTASRPPAQAPRPLPDPSSYTTPATTLTSNTRTDDFLSSNAAPAPLQSRSHIPSEAAHSTSAEQDVEASRRIESQQKTKAGGWASKSLLEREMERERERQREWEEQQRATSERAGRGETDANAGTGPGQSWDVNSYGFTGGDNLNKGGGGVFAGRRQIIGPRAMGGKGN